MIKEIKETISNLGLNDLPDGKKIVEEGKAFSQNVKITQSLFSKKYGVSSELEYKRKRMAQKEIMFHMQYGLTDLEKSAEGLQYIYEEVTKRGHRIDRFGNCLDRVMGLPEEMRDLVPRETGLKLNSFEEWKQIGQIVPIQPHFADPIISSPAGVENLLGCLNAGATTIGNFCTYFNFEYPLWNDDVSRLSIMLKALGIMAGLKDQGVMVHSNLDDGFCGMFYDRCSILGWAMLEHYIVNKAIGAKLTHCFGNMVTNTLQRMSTVLVLDRIHEYDLVGSMIYGDTISPTTDIDRNYGTTASYLLNDIVMQMYHPTGHALNPLPINETIVIPTPDDIVKVQMLGAQLALEAEHQYEITDFRKIEDFAEVSYNNSKKFFDRIMEAFSDVIDIEDPFKLMYGLKRLGAETVENMFCESTPFHGAAIDRQPYVETGVYKMITSFINDVLDKVDVTEQQAAKIRGKKAVIACTDVHSFGVKIVHAVLSHVGIEVVNMGCNADTVEVVKALTAEKPDILVLSTYNGFALSYAKDLKKRAEEAGVWGNAKVFMGGRLNDDAGQAVPVDVTDDLIELGIIPSLTIETLPDLIDAAM